MTMKNAVSIELQKPPMLIPGTIPAASIIVIALTTKLNKPRVRMLNGSAIKSRIGLRTRLTSSRTSPMMRMAMLLPMYTQLSILETRYIEKIIDKYFKKSFGIFPPTG